MKGINVPDENEIIQVNGIPFSHGAIFKVIDDFYTRIQLDLVLQVPFRSVEDWPHHIERLTHFWWTRFGGRAYLFNDYNPVPKHFFAGFNRELLTRWLQIFHDTIHGHLNSDQSKLWKLVSERMGEALFMRNELFRRDYEQRET